MSAAQDAHHTRQDGPQRPSGLETAVVPTVDAAAVLRDHRMSRAVRARDDAVRLLCSVDRRPWRGDGETGGCAARLLAREVVALRARAERERTRDALRIDTLQIMLREGSKRIDAATDRAERLAGLLREMEWGARVGGLYIPRCPLCLSAEGREHDPDCRLAAALADGG